MSEYQYYEFQAIDRRLTQEEMSVLRSFSSRAAITPTSFVNEYSWGDFKGNEGAWMAKYFDAHVYLANWGTHRIAFALPVQLLDPDTAGEYCVGEGASLEVTNGRAVLFFSANDEDDGEWVESSGVLSSLIPVREQLARGDLRALYLGWLLCAQEEELDDEALEPPVPAGLGRLGGALASFVEFLGIDQDLVDAAASASAPLDEAEPGRADLRAWVAALAGGEKDELLARVMAGDGAVAPELLQRMRRDRAAGEGSGTTGAARRTVAELLGAAASAAEERAHREAVQAAAERARSERAAAAARQAHLDRLAGKEEALWRQVEALIATKQPKRYDEAVQSLVDLRDLAARGDAGDFGHRLELLRGRHSTKPSLIERIRKAGL